MKRTLLRNSFHNLLAGWKFVLSFRKREWMLEDYPVIVRKQRDKSLSWGDTVRYTEPAFVARILNWTLSGSGDTAEAAVDDLRASFNRARENRSSMPRPGTNVPIEFASFRQVASNLAIRDEFVHSVLGLEWALITDESSLWHFTLGNSLDDYYAKIQSHYGVDVSDVQDGNLAAIFERIAQSRKD